MPEELFDNAKIRELESTAQFPILEPAHARIKLAAQYWARLGRLLNDITQGRPYHSKIDEALDLLKNFREIPDNPILRGKEADKAKVAVDELEAFLLSIQKVLQGEKE